MSRMARARFGWLVMAGLMMGLCHGAVEAATLALGEATATPGQAQVGLPLSLQVGTTEQVSAVAVDIRFDPALASFGSVELNSSIAALGKQVGTNLLAPGHVRLVLYGLDRQTLSSGTLGTCRLGVTASAPDGAAQFDLQQGTSVNADGAETPLTLTGGRIWIEGVDTVKPTLTVASPVDGASLILGQSWTISGTAVDDKPGAVTVTVNGSATTVGANGSFSMTLTNSTIGNKTLTVQATDAAGNLTQVVRQVTVLAAGSSAPAVQFVTPTPGSTNTTSVSFSFSVQNATISSTGMKIRVAIDGGTPRTLDSVLPYVWTSVDPGTHTAIAQLVSATGVPLTNPEAKATVTFTTASTTTSGISLTVVTPQPGSTITGSTSVKIQVSVKGIAVKTGTGSAHLHYKIDGGSVSHVYNTYPFYYINLKPGTHTLNVMLADNTTHERIAGTQYYTITFTVAP